MPAFGPSRLQLFRRRGYEGSMKAIWAGLAYALAVFGFAFLTGALRTIAVSSFGLSPVLAVIIELPVILLAAWSVCGLVISRMHVPAHACVRTAMAIVALAVMLSAEFALSAILIGRSLPEFVAGYRQPEAILGLMGQLAFAAFPLVRMRSG